ncbi:hypothetical protein NDA12_005459 [Ustilago hordei]|nr:hypothetical protein NDA15_001419 [Ustilago hordei]KAJ1592079.1 hypothetical protein NDA12_005459 [Ustilago hordei]
MSEAAKATVNTRMPKGAKRPKTWRACLACRKLKARCEPAAGAKTVPTDDPQSSNHPQSSKPSFVICHRCKTLCIDCLYESPTGQVVKGEHVQPTNSTPSPFAEHNKPPRSQKRSRPDHLNAAASDPFSNDRAIFLSPAISPSALTRSIYRDIEICSLNLAPPSCLERPVLPANAFSRLIGANPALKREAQDCILNLSGAFGSSSSQNWKQASQRLCAGKAAARIMSGQSLLTPYPKEELDFLCRFLVPHEHHLRILFQGLYGAFSPFLSTPFEDSLGLATCQTEAQTFLLLTIYLTALPHREATNPIDPACKPLRKAVDALLRRAMHTPLNDHLNIFALHNCASFLLLPVDGLAEDHRPLSTSEQENDGLLEFALDLNPRAASITALGVAQRLGYASLAAKLPTLRQTFDVDSPATGIPSDTSRDEYAHAILCTFTWLTLLQFRASIDVAEDRIEWDALVQFEHDIPRVRIQALTAALLPPPAFLSPREQSRCCWTAQRAELYAIARDHRHTKRAAATLTKKEAEEQALGYKKALDEWRYKFNEQMRSMSTEFRKDPRGLGLHRYYSIFSNAEAASLQVAIGSVYHKEFVADMRQRLTEPFYRDNLPWKSAATIMIGHEEDQLTKAILINFAFTDAMLKAMGLISSLTPVMPQLYDFVSFEETAGSEIPSLCIVAPPIVQAGLFAVPLLAAADLRLSVVETWGASASYFNHHLLPLLTNCVKSLRACHVNVDLPGVLKMPFTTANPIADYLQGPFEILMRKVASAEERLQISHVESILNNAFLLSSKKKQIETLAEELAPDTPEMVQSIADSQKVEDEIAASMMGSLHVQAIQEIEDTEYAVKVFGSDMREGDVRPIRKSGKNASSSVTTPDAGSTGEGAHRKASSNARSVSLDSEQTTASPSVLTNSSGKQRSPMHTSVRSVADNSQFSSPGSSTQSGPGLYPEPSVYGKDNKQMQQQQQQQGFEVHGPRQMYPARTGGTQFGTQASHLQHVPSPYQVVHQDPAYSEPYQDRNAGGPTHGYTQGQQHRDGKATDPSALAPGQDSASYAPYPAPPTDQTYANNTNDAYRSDTYTYRPSHPNPDVPSHLQMQPAPGYDGMQRHFGDVESKGAVYDDGYPDQQQWAQCNPQLKSQYGPGPPYQPNQSHAKFGSFSDPSAHAPPQHTDMSSGPYYPAQQQGYSDPQYQSVGYAEGQQHPAQQGFDTNAHHIDGQRQYGQQQQQQDQIWDASWNWIPGQPHPPAQQYRT